MKESDGWGGKPDNRKITQIPSWLELSKTSRSSRGRRKREREEGKEEGRKERREERREGGRKGGRKEEREKGRRKIFRILERQTMISFLGFLMKLFLISKQSL